MSLPFRLALVGAHGTGKTTLCGELVSAVSSEGFRVRQVPEVPRLICERAKDSTFFRRNKNSPLKQTLLLIGQIVYESPTENEDLDLLICDRSLLDHWAYMKYLFADEFKSLGLENIYESLILQYCSNYNLICYLPIEFAPVDDGTREADIKFQADIDLLIHSSLETLALPYTTITGSVEHRTAACLEMLRTNLQTRRI